MGMMLAPPTALDHLDWAVMRSRIDLAARIRADCGEPRGGRYACPFAAHSRPNLAVFDAKDGKRWKCHACVDKGGTVFDWMIQVHGAANAVEAARMLGLIEEGGRQVQRPISRPLLHAPSTEVRLARPEAWQDAEWQAAVDRIVRRAQATLWDPEKGRDGRRWLKHRGITRAIAVRFRLGFIPRKMWLKDLAVLADPDGNPKSYPVPRGITIPWLAPGSNYLDPRAISADLPPHPDDEPPGERPRWVGVNVRRLADDIFGPLDDPYGKCQSIKGSVPGYGYPWPNLDPSQGHPDALIVEGEVDALLAEMFLGHRFFVTTTGGARQKPRQSLTSALEACPRWLLALDNDKDGIEAAARWRQYNPDPNRRDCPRLLLPDGIKDLGDLVASGVDPGRWLDEQLAEIDGPEEDSDED